MQTLKPWLNDDYIRKAHFNDKGYFTLMFVDGGQKVYQVDDCTAAQLKDAIELMRRPGADRILFIPGSAQGSGHARCRAAYGPEGTLHFRRASLSII
jgi:hypothetical protein